MEILLAIIAVLTLRWQAQNPNVPQSSATQSIEERAAFIYENNRYEVLDNNEVVIMDEVSP